MRHKTINNYKKYINTDYEPNDQEDERVLVRPSAQNVSRNTNTTKLLPTHTSLNEKVIKNIQKLPAQTRVAVGNHDESFWQKYQDNQDVISSLDGEYNYHNDSLVDVDRNAELIDNNDYITDAAYPTVDEINGQSMDVYHQVDSRASIPAEVSANRQMQASQHREPRHISRGSASNPTPTSANREPQQQKEQARKDRDEFGVSVGHYVILRKGKTIASNVTKEEAEHIINRIIFDNVIPGYEDQIKSEISIFKRVNFEINTVICYK